MSCSRASGGGAQSGGGIPVSMTRNDEGCMKKYDKQGSVFLWTAPSYESRDKFNPHQGFKNIVIVTNCTNKPMIVDRDNVYHNIEFTKLFQTILDSQSDLGRV